MWIETGVLKGLCSPRGLCCSDNNWNWTYHKLKASRNSVFSGRYIGVCLVCATETLAVQVCYLETLSAATVVCRHEK